MRVLHVDYAGHPFTYELSVELGRRGHTVTHTYSASTTGPRAAFRPAPNVEVAPVDLGRTFERYRPLRRIRDELSYGWRTVRLARRVGAQRILTANVPVLSLGVIWLWAAARRVRWVLWLQDVQSGLVAVAGGAGAIGRLLGAIERFLMRRSDHVVAISDNFAGELGRARVPADRVTVIENWAPIAELPVRPKRNPWSVAHGLDDKFVFLYSGTLGAKHSPHLLKALAEEFDGDPDVRVVAVGEGAGADWLAEQPGARPLQLGYQPFEDVPDVLASADVLVVLLDPAAGGFSVPSKTLAYLCAGRALLAAVPSENLAARLVAERAHAGVVADPGDAEAFCKAARELVADPALRARYGRNGRDLAERAFQIAPIAERFEAVLGTGREQPVPGRVV